MHHDALSVPISLTGYTYEIIHLAKQQSQKQRNITLSAIDASTALMLAIQLNSSKTMAKDAPGMRGHRSRNESGPLRQKRSDTHIGTIEKQYNIDLKVRSDMELGTYLEKKNIKSLNDLITE